MINKDNKGLLHERIHNFMCMSFIIRPIIVPFKELLQPVLHVHSFSDYKCKGTIYICCIVFISQAVEEAFVPVIKMTFDGIEVWILLVQYSFEEHVHVVYVH